TRKVVPRGDSASAFSPVVNEATAVIAKPARAPVLICGAFRRRAATSTPRPRAAQIENIVARLQSWLGIAATTPTDRAATATTQAPQAAASHGTRRSAVSCS